MTLTARAHCTGITRQNLAHQSSSRACKFLSAGLQAGECDGRRHSYVVHHCGGGMTAQLSFQAFESVTHFFLLLQPCHCVWLKGKGPTCSGLRKPLLVWIALPEVSLLSSLLGHGCSGDATCLSQKSRKNSNNAGVTNSNKSSRIAVNDAAIYLQACFMLLRTHLWIFTDSSGYLGHTQEHTMK